MSVINNVLKDLDSKPSVFVPLNVEMPPTESNTNKKSTYLWLGGIIIIPVVLFVLHKNDSLFGLDETWQQPEQRITEIASQSIRQPDVIVTEVVNEKVSVTEPVETDANEITGLQINETESFMELTFQLTKEAQSYLKERTSNRYIFQLSNGVTNIETPVIGENPWLRNLKIDRLPDAVNLQFDTRKDVLVETNGLQENENFIWSIKLKKPIQTEVVNKASSATTVLAINTKAETKQSEVASQINEPEKNQTVKKREIKLEINPTGQPGPIRSDAERLKRAVMNYRAKNWQAAEQGFKQLVGSQEDKLAREYLINVLLQQNKSKEAETWLQESIERYPEDLNFKLAEANRLFSAKKYQQLIDEFSLESRQKEILKLLSTSYQLTNQHDKAIEGYQKILLLEPHQPKHWIGLGISQQYESRFSQALHSFQMAAKNGELNERLQAFVQQRIKQLSP